MLCRVVVQAILLASLTLTSLAAPLTPRQWTSTTKWCGNCNARLWNSTGPNIKDVRQVEFDDCWWKAVQVAILHVSPSIIKSLFLDPTNNYRPYSELSEEPWAPDPVVKLFNPTSGPNLYQPEYFNASINYRSALDDKGSQLGVFWPDALTQAMRQTSALHGIRGYNYTIGNLDTDNPDFGTAMSVLTGQPAWVDEFKSLANTSDQLWELIKEKEPARTPMIFNTKYEKTWFNNGTDLQIEPSHAYPIISTYINETTGMKMLETRNVWGRQDNFTMGVVWNSGDCVAHMRDWTKFS